MLPVGEEAACLAVGKDFVAAATSALMIRLFTTAGIPSAMFSLPGKPIALAAHGSLLAAVWNTGISSDGGQSLSYAVRNHEPTVAILQTQVDYADTHLLSRCRCMTFLKGGSCMSAPCPLAVLP